MKPVYNPGFLRDLRKLKKQKEIYQRIRKLAFETIPDTGNIRDIPGVKGMVGHPGYYRIRLGSYRLGVKLTDDTVELVRVLHRREIYRNFP